MRAIRSTTRRSGLTLMELLLALTLLAAIASLAWPSMQRSFENRRLQFAAEQLRGDLTQARAKAIRTGSVFLLRYRPEGAEYAIEPYQVDLLASTGVDDVLIGAEGETSDVHARDVMTVERQLPEGVAFVGGELEFDSRAAELSFEIGDLNRLQSPGELPEQMIFCYPDGTTSTARLALANERRVIVLNVRGLTGVVTIEEIAPREELPP